MFLEIGKLFRYNWRRDYERKGMIIRTMDVVLQALREAVTFIFSHLLIINVLLSIVIVFFQRKNPKSVWAWLLILYFIPVLGFVFYLLIGADMHKIKMFRTKEIEDRLSNTIRRQEMIIKGQELQDTYPGVNDYSDLVMYHLKTTGALLTDDNEIQFFVNGNDKFAALKEDMGNAESSIHIQYYIIKNDEVFQSIVEILKEKVKQGVEVRILFDAMGCRTVRRKVWKQLEKAGIQTAEFFPALIGKLNLRVNYRNHRKIVVIDGKTGYVGGFNVAREYIGKDPKFGNWRDTHMRITGSSVAALQVRFILDWNFADRERVLSFEKYIQQVNTEHMGKAPVQIITSGPDSQDQHIRNTYVRMIHKAKKSIYIQTPYFIPDESLMNALLIALRSGVEVNIMIPCKPDHPFVYWATYSYVGELVLEGAKCYTYQNGFLHAKGIVVDELLLCYGTANMDIRSFALDFEVNALIYDEQKAREMVHYFKKDVQESKLLTRNKYQSRSLFIRFKEQISRLLSPLL